MDRCQSEPDLSDMPSVAAKERRKGLENWRYYCLSGPRRKARSKQRKAIEARLQHICETCGVDCLAYFINELGNVECYPTTGSADEFVCMFASLEESRVQHDRARLPMDILKAWARFSDTDYGMGALNKVLVPFKEFGLSELLLDQVSSSYSLQLAGEGSVESVRAELAAKIAAALKEYVQEHTLCRCWRRVPRRRRRLRCRLPWLWWRLLSRRRRLRWKLSPSAPACVRNILISRMKITKHLARGTPPAREGGSGRWVSE